MCPQITRHFELMLTFGKMSMSSEDTKDETTQNILKEDEVERKMKTREKKRNAFENTGVYSTTSNTECPRKCGIACQFKTVTIQNKRKPEENYNFSSKAKIGRSENKDNNFERKQLKEEERTIYTDHQHSEFEEKQNLVTHLLKKDKDGDTYVD